MGKQSGLADNFYVGGYDLSGDVCSVDQVSCPWDVVDFTAVNEEAHERQTTLRTGDMSFTTFMDLTGTVSNPSVPASGTPYVSTYNFYVLVTITGGTVTGVTVNGSSVGTGDGTYLLPPLGSITLTYSVAPTWAWSKVGASHDALSGLPRTDQVMSYFRGQAVGNKAASLLCKQTSYDWTRDTTGGLSGKVTAVANGFGLEWGKQLTAGLRVDTAATAGAFYDDGSSSAFGGQAYFHLVAFAGTSVTIDIQHSATSGGSYTSTGLTSQAFTGIGSQRVAIANTTTIDEFLKVATTGTFTYARFAVMFRRNEIAGITF